MNEVTGSIRLGSGVAPPQCATVYVRLIDTTEIDAPAREVASQVLRCDDWSSVAESGLEFRIKAQRVIPHRRYEVSVHVDCDGDGQLSPGDYYTTRSYPALTRGFPNDLIVEVNRIE